MRLVLDSDLLRLTSPPGEIDSIMVRESTYRDRIFQLEKDLEVYKRAYAGLQFESAQLQTRKQEIEKQNEELASRVKVRCSLPSSVRIYLTVFTR